MSPVPSYGRCGLCTEVKPYPLIKVPLGPAEVVDDEETSKEVGLPVKDGYVEYSSFCLNCSRTWLDKLTESYLIDGTVSEDQEVVDKKRYYNLTMGWIVCIAMGGVVLGIGLSWLVVQ